MIPDLLKTPAPLTAADAIAMCLASAVVGAALLVILTIAWVRIRIWLDHRRIRRELRARRSILHRI